MRRTPEALIDRLRNRKNRIVAFSICAVLCLSLFIFSLWVFVKASNSLTLTDGQDIVLHVAIMRVTVPLLVYTQMAVLIAGAVACVFAGLAVTEVTTFTKNDLLVNLWDRVEVLEQRLAAASSARSQDSPSAGG